MTPARIAELRRYSAEVYVPFLVECLNEIERLRARLDAERARCVALVRVAVCADVLHETLALARNANQRGDADGEHRLMLIVDQESEPLRAALAAVEASDG